MTLSKSAYSISLFEMPKMFYLRMGFDGLWDGMDGQGIHTLWVYRSCIYLLIYMIYIHTKYEEN